MNWFSIAHRAETALVSLRDDLGGFTSDFADFKTKLGTPTRVELSITSCGGDSFVACQIYDLLRGIETETVISGHCFSAAVTAALAGRKIQMFRGSKILIHPPVAYSVGTPDRLRMEANGLEKMTDKIAEIIRARTGQPKSIVTEWLSKDSWFDCDQAKAAGLIDEILEPSDFGACRSPSTKSGQAVNPSDRAELSEREQLFYQWLTAFGKIEVADKQKFSRELQHWLAYNVKET